MAQVSIRMVLETVIDILHAFWHAGVKDFYFVCMEGGKHKFGKGNMSRTSKVLDSAGV